ncbi:MAG: DUF5711 family protein [Eubacteriales bacterium]|nr:DUF5711 family protein [Eubacteriales bacterium]
MANMLKTFRKKQKRKKMLAKKARLEKAQASASGGKSAPPVHNRARRKADALKRTLIIACLAVAAVVLIAVYVEKRSYHRYKILHTSEQEDVISTKYVELDGKILRYSPEGASLVNDKMETIWNETYEMQNPVADVCGKRAVIADRDGTTMEIYDRDGWLGSVSTSYSIVKARISANGLVAAILDGGDDTWINFYASDGSLIAENQTKVDDPGYPLDVAVSEDGLIMMVTYQFVDGGNTTSYVAFYNFGDVGQNEDDRIVSGYTYEGVVIPQIQYLSGDRSVALRDDGFTLYKGKQIPKESSSVKVDKEIVSTFFDDEIIGLVFKNGKKDALYTMEVYSTSGKLKFSKNFNIPYTSIKMSGGNILLYNSSQMSVMNSRGVEKYSGTVDGTINDFFKIGWNRYLLVLDSGVNIIKFS